MVTNSQWKVIVILLLIVIFILGYRVWVLQGLFEISEYYVETYYNLTVQCQARSIECLDLLNGR